MRDNEVMNASNRVDLFGISIHDVTLPQAVKLILASLDGEKAACVFFVNADCVNLAYRDAEYKAILRDGDLVFADGVGMRLAARAFGAPLLDNVNGTDLFPELCEALSGSSRRIFLLGGAPGVAEQLRERMSDRWPGVVICGAHHGYFNEQDNERVIALIRESRADLLLVAMGAPRQEKWIAAYAEAAGVRAAMGVGGLFNFYSDRIPRAPRWMRTTGLEWLHRLWMEPARLWRRYLIGNAIFLSRIVWLSLFFRVTAKRNSIQP
ncbi:MAG: WecB/TagA/CpsF family glycosyltransferase [bacterium]|nr:WecB/TagA/CpsF family glycosyltransferase [bacterium]